MSRMLDHLICGSTFGALHAAASSISGCRLIGVLGKGSSRTSSLAAAYGVPSITDINEVPRTSGGVASVALRSPSLGGDSVEVALSLAERGWNVLVEGPLSKKRHHNDRKRMSQNQNIVYGSEPLPQPSEHPRVQKSGQKASVSQPRKPPSRNSHHKPGPVPCAFRSV